MIEARVAPPTSEGERAALQALLRGAAEALTLMPDTAPRRRGVAIMHEGLVKILAAEDER